MPGGRSLAAVLVAVWLGACAGTEGEPPFAASDDTSPAPVEESVEVQRNVDVGGSETDIFLPPDRGPALPVVVMLHGTAGDRSRMAPLATSVAEDGALVYTPSWPSIDTTLPILDEEGDEPFRVQSEAVICTLRQIKLTAAELGGDPDDVTLVGHSGGGMIGARVSLVNEPPWPGIDCDAGVDHRPARFIGMAGDYQGLYQYAQYYRDLYAPYDVLAIEPTNLDLEVWLLHGQNDDTVGVYSSMYLVDHLRGAGIDPQLLTTDSTHAAALDTSTAAGRFTADQISAIAHGTPEPVWWPSTDGPADATVSFDDQETCTYDGPATWPRGQPMTIRMENRTDVDMWFALVSIRDDVDWTEQQVLAGDGDLAEDAPDWVDWGGFQPVAPQREQTMRFAFVEGDQTFVVYCHPDPEADHPRPNWMYPSAVLAPSDDVGDGSAPTGGTPSTTIAPTGSSVHLVGNSITAMHGGTIVSGLTRCGWDVELHSMSARRVELAYEWHDRWVTSGIGEIESILTTNDPDTWIIELGSNDLQDLRVAEDARRLIDAALDRIGPEDRVLWTTVLWRGHDEAALMFNDALRSTPGLETVGWDEIGRDHLADSVHPTSHGASLLAELYCRGLGAGPDQLS